MKADDDQTPTDYRKRVTTSLPDEDYTLLDYLAYCLYPPLYIAGPIITFNDFVWQVSSYLLIRADQFQLRHPVPISRREQLSYLIRFAFCLLTMESVLHTMYVVAIKDTAAWAGDGPADLSMIGFWSLVVVWMKVCFSGR